ncbi:MAG: ABC transporter permease [Phycisphaeraceae bacterium]
MFSYLIRRLVLMVPTLLGVLAVVFFIMAFAPGGFGGAALSQEGAQAEGMDARRIRKQFERRYGLDQPKVVQFGRWLNQVSPLGFRMSSDVAFQEEVRAAVRRSLADLPMNTRPARLERATDLTLEMAAYLDTPPPEVARRLENELRHPLEAIELFAFAELEPSDRLKTELRERIERLLVRENGLARAQNALLEELDFEFSGVSRVRFDQPAFKVPDLGESLKGRRVTDLLAERVPITVLLNLLSLPLIYSIAMVTGVYAARHRGSFVDWGSGFLFVALWSLPVIWVGVMAINYLANEEYLRLFPTTGLHALQADQMPFFPRVTDAGFERGWLLDALWHLVLPVFCLTYGGLAVMSKVMRGSILDNLSSDYVRTARAKGVDERVVLWRHVFRNSVLPLITMAAGLLPALFVGSVVVETIFSINGMGRLAVEASFSKDREVVMATTLIAGLLSLTAQLVRDIFYALADPRVSYE